VAEERPSEPREGRNDPPPTQQPSPEPPKREREAPTGAEAEGDEVARLRHESAQRRVRLREVEQERDALRDQVAALRRAEVERMAAERLEDPADLWRHDGIELDPLLGDDGTPDAERVGEAIGQVLEAHPGWAKGRPVDFGAGARRSPPEPPSFGEAFKRQLGQRPG
jgi:hypothetical protein